ncbi:type II toxin-antitoxin system HicA family toxin [Treponema sp. OMZ 840]|uniref:type II toxin-antitoxin system HicA family toxin n=1 Tax=Treponema sp. OMZ 840 TaxID=244313 RepID=UPI003D8D4855
MSQWDKLLKKIKSLDNNMRFSELAKVLENYGYIMTVPRSGSSHYTFRKKGLNPITIPKHEPIKTAYVRIVRDIVEVEENNSQEESK